MRELSRRLRRIGVFMLMVAITVLIIIEPAPRFFKHFVVAIGTMLGLHRLRPWFECRPLWFAVLVVGLSGSIFGICEVAQYPIAAFGFFGTALAVHFLKWTAFPITRFFFRMYKKILLAVYWIRRSYKHGCIAWMYFTRWLNTKEWYTRPVAFKATAKVWLRQTMAQVRIRLAANKERKVILAAKRLRDLRILKGECIG